MKNLIFILIVIVLAAGLATTGYLYAQNNNKLNTTRSQINTLMLDVTTLQNAVTTSPGKTTIPVSTPNQVSPAPQSLSSVVTDIVSQLEPMIVRVDVTGPGFAGSGSGFFIRNDGYLMTNEHVIDSAMTIKVTLMNGDQFPATVAASDTNLDLAIVKLTTTRTNFPTVTLGSANDIIVGEDAVAIGFPLGTDLPGPATFSRGIVSAIRTLSGSQYIQTDVEINPGNSGGMLVNDDQKVIGIPSSSILPAGLDIEGIGLAIPCNVVQTYINNNLK